MPDGPLRNLVKLMSFPKLSIFNSGFKNGSNSDCIFVLQRYLCSNLNNLNRYENYMFADDITAIFSYLTSNGYTIEKSISKMMNESRVVIGSNSNRSMICIASFIGS
jgi:hypothetical protein